MNGAADWPDGKRFAFTVFDDTDNSTAGNVSPVYDLLHGLGFLTTKSVWPVKGSQTPAVGGDTCEDPAYLQWVLRLQEAGFEIGLHNVTYHTSSREQTRQGLARFHELFGSKSCCLANHANNREGIYWGTARLSSWRAALYTLLTRFRRRGFFQGHLPASEFFWGDLCKESVQYARNFVYQDINTLKMCPMMPYHDPQRPNVNAWFASCEGSNVQTFTSAIREANQDRLEEEGGCCIMCTHFACGFCRQGSIDREFRRLLERLAGKNGWFVPASTLLDHLRKRNGLRVLTDRQRKRLEIAWLKEKIFRGES